MMQWLNDSLGLMAEDLTWDQMMLRAVIVYFVALVYIRLAGMRSFGTNSAFDVVVTITIGAIFGRAILGSPFFESLLAALALALCHRAIAFVSYKSGSIRRLTEGNPVLLFKDGTFVHKNLSLHSIHPTDLERALREKGIDTYDKVKSIWYEVDGRISVVTKE